MAAQDAVSIYNELDKSAAFVFVVYFRGHWCPFCMLWLTELETLRASIEKRQGAILVVTAEKESELEPVRKVFAGKIVSDPHNELAAHLRKAELVDIAITPKSGYEHGMAQPGVLVMQNNQRLYSWAIVPSMMNVGGAKDRPSLTQIRDNVFAQLDGKEKPHTTLQTQSFWQGIRFKMFGKSS